MSPEQAAGHAVDFRSDQFAFGSILYEMATGRRAFQQKTAVDTLSAILNDEPQPIAAVNPETPAPLQWLAERCLSKDPDDRYVSTRDLARELRRMQSHLSQPASGLTVENPRRPSRRPLFTAIAVGAAICAAGLVANRIWAARQTTMTVPSFRQLTFRRGNLLTARFAPDGKTVAYAAAWDGLPSEIFTVRTDSVASTSIGLRGADVMSVSSKGELAVLIHKTHVWGPAGAGTLARVPLNGGTPRELLENVLWADWAPNGQDLAV